MSRRNHVEVSWSGGHAFTGGRPTGPKIQLDGDAVLGPGPVDALLMSLASCTSIDVVEMMAKRRTPVTSLDIDVKGDRAGGPPARLTRIVLRYTMSGEGLDRDHAERAIDLSINKYCSVKDSLNPDIPVEWSLELK